MDSLGYKQLLFTGSTGYSRLLIQGSNKGPCTIANVNLFVQSVIVLIIVFHERIINMRALTPIFMLCLNK